MSKLFEQSRKKVGHATQRALKDPKEGSEASKENVRRLASFPREGPDATESAKPGALMTRVQGLRLRKASNIIDLSEACGKD